MIVKYETRREARAQFERLLANRDSAILRSIADNHLVFSPASEARGHWSTQATGELYD